MKHPDPEIQKNQDNILSQFPESEREYHASFFRICNAACIYHQLPNRHTNQTLKSYYYEWLDGLPATLMQKMKSQGFHGCKDMLPFLRYVNERNDIGMDEFMKAHLSEEDYNSFKNS